MNSIIEKYKQDLIIRGLSPRTQEIYVGIISRFLSQTKKQPSTIKTEDIKYFLNDVITRCISMAAAKQASGALKNFFTYTLGKPELFKSIPVIKGEKTLPEFLTVNEVLSLLKIVQNLKHKTILTLTYSSGLRVSEIINLLPQNIYRDVMRLKVVQGKGKKDRYTLLSSICLKLLEKYWRVYRPQKWLFESQQTNDQLSIRTCQSVFTSSKEKVGIKKKGGIHLLRHSFATHFLQAGGNMLLLQDILGHNSINTTKRYAHLNLDNSHIVSPLDYYAKSKDFNC